MSFPIRTRLTAVYCAVFCVGAAALESGAYFALKLAAYAIADRDLESRMAGVEEFLADHVQRLSTERLQKELRSHAALQPQLLEIWEDQRGSLYVAEALAPYGAETSSGSSQRYWTGDKTGQPLRIYLATRKIKGHVYRLWVAAELSGLFDILHRFALSLLLTAPIVLAIAAAAGHWMAGRALSPVLAMTIAARSIDMNDLRRRIEVPNANDELHFLAATLNGMLERIEGGFARTTQFVANASHELRTPLAVIRANAEVALLRPPNAEADRVALRRILREAEKNSVLLEDLLVLARIDSHAAAVRLESVDFGELVRLTCERFAPLAVKRRIALRFIPASRELSIAADVAQLKRLLLILLDNATKYTPSGGWIEVSMQETDHAQACCQIVDSGIGISAEDLPHIFERFFRADPARNREEGGTGLGLAIGEWIVQAHRGRIEVESVPGRGSTFRVLIPRMADVATSAGEVSVNQLS